jgi:hypothetical protein
LSIFTQGNMKDVLSNSFKDFLQQDQTLPVSYKNYIISAMGGLTGKRVYAISAILGSAFLQERKTTLDFGSTDIEVELSLFVNNNLIGDLGGRNNPIDRGISYDVIAIQSSLEAAKTSTMRLGDKLVGQVEKIKAGMKTFESPGDETGEMAFFRRVQQGAVEPSMFAGARQNWRNIMLGSSIILNLDPSDEARLGNAVREVNPQFSSVRGYRVHRIDEKVATSKQVPIQLNTSMSSPAAQAKGKMSISALDPTQPISSVLETTASIAKTQSFNGSAKETLLSPHMEQLGAMGVIVTFDDGTRRLIGTIDENINRISSDRKGGTATHKGNNLVNTFFNRLKAAKRAKRPQGGGSTDLGGVKVDLNKAFVSKPISGQLTSTQEKYDEIVRAGLEGLTPEESKAFLTEQRQIAQAPSMVGGRLAETLSQPEGMQIFARAASDYVKNTVDPNYYVADAQVDLVLAAQGVGVNIDIFADMFDNNTVRQAGPGLKADLQKVRDELSPRANSGIYKGKGFTAQEILSNNIDIFKGEK